MLDPHALTAYFSALSSLLDFLFVCSFVFFFLKKKKIWFPWGPFVGLATPPGGGEARRSALLRRPSGVSSEKGALCGGRAGGQGPGHRFPLLVYSARTDGSFCRLRGGRGLRGTLRVCARLRPLHSAADQTLRSLAILSHGAPKPDLKSCWNWAGELARKLEAVTESLNGRGGDG